MLRVHTFLEKCRFHSWQFNRGNSWMWLGVTQFYLQADQHSSIFLANSLWVQTGL